MGPKSALIFVLLLSLSLLCVEGQRDGRRRTGRRKPTTESPALDEETENESSPQKLDAEIDTVAKPANVQPPEVETSSPPAQKESNGSNSGGPPFILPRGTRKPRPMQVRGNSESRPRPTLPTFARKHSARMPKPDRQDKKPDDNQLGSSTSTTTPKPSRNSSRRRNSAKETPVAEKSPQNAEVEETSTEAAQKKRFGGGGGGRRQNRGSRRNNPVTPEE